jgi:neutral trehalase
MSLLGLIQEAVGAEDLKPGLSEKREKERKGIHELQTKPESHITPGAKFNGTRKWERFFGHGC